MTPEGRVKDAVKKLLSKYEPELDQFWPVQNGMGKPVLDCIICFGGYYATIETKAPGKKPTARQEVTIERMKAAGAEVFVIDDSTEAALLPLQNWLVRTANYLNC